ncbi:DUF4276 family protein [Maridesulfovibrio sp.]|uniref:DUF4276 family protein n=1 Tax=Maridesulfovibrio sp. TaxID=2795000 RepID=UPI0039EE2F4F
MSKNVAVICEGPTERIFVEKLLSKYIPNLSFHPILLGICAGNSCGGGDIIYGRFKDDFAPASKDPRYDYVTTLFDYYGLGAGWPEVEQLDNPRDRVERLESATLELIKTDFPDSEEGAFIPFFLLHEFEGLLFSDTGAMNRVLRQPQEIFDKIIEECGEPEFVNGGVDTAPSKRLKVICGNYPKVKNNRRLSKAVTIEKMRQECPHFRDWLTKLESLTD